MNRNRIAAILMACAVVLASGAYFLVANNQPKDTSVVRQEVAQPEETAQPPAWVGEEQEAKPDYSSAEPEQPKAEPAPAPKPQKQSTTVVEVKEDKVVTYGFIDALVDYTLTNFEPQDKYGRPATHASARTLSTRFGVDMTGFKTSGDSISAARKFVLNYAFTPEMVETLYKLYAPLYVEQLVETASNDTREYQINDDKVSRTLENLEIAAMLRLDSVRISQTAAVFKAIAADPRITDMVGAYLQAAKNVDRVNARLQTAIADGKDTSEEGARLKQAIMQRERIKEDTVALLQDVCPDCEPKDLFHMARWSYRRVLGNPEKLATFNSVSSVLDDLAKRFQNKAAELDR